MAKLTSKPFWQISSFHKLKPFLILINPLSLSNSVYVLCRYFLIILYKVYFSPAKHEHEVNSCEKKTKDLFFWKPKEIPHISLGPMSRRCEGRS